jgi:hypothetical protein
MKKIVRKIKPKFLYHLIDNYGLGLSIQYNAIKAFRQNYISTTYNPEMNDIIGREYAFYKFILDGKKLAANYGAFYYKYKTHSGEYLEEYEIGIDTDKIEPLSDYLLGIVLLMKRPFHDTNILFLADRNNDSESVFNEKKTATIYAIEALKKANVPLYWQEKENFVKFDEKDFEYLNDIEESMKDAGGKTRKDRHLEIIDRLLNKYNIKDMWGKDISKQTIVRKKLVPKMMQQLNEYFRDRRVKDVNPTHLKAMFAHFLQIMGYGSNTISMLLGVAEENNFFHPTTKAVQWTNVIYDLLYDDIEEAIIAIKQAANKWEIENYNNEPDFKWHLQMKHDGTDMSGY